MTIRRVEAIIRPERLEELRSKLEEVGYPGMTVTEVEGHGKQRGMERQWRGSKYKIFFLPKVKIEIVVAAKEVKKLVDTIIAVCGSGKVGDGKIFVTEVMEVIRIRTKEKNNAAL